MPHFIGGPRRRTRTRLEGGKELIGIVARRNPVVDDLMTAKDASGSLYKVVKGKEPPFFKELLDSAPMRWEKREARRERAFDRRFGG